MTVTTDAISSALVHSLWQNAAVGVLLWIVLVALRHRTANARYLASCVALALMVVLPVVTALVLSQPTAPVASLTPTAAAIADSSVANTMLPPPEPIWVEAEGWQVNWLALLKPWMLPFWLAGVLVCSLRLVLASMHTVVLRRLCAVEQGPIAALVATLAARLGVRRAISIRVAPTTIAPATFGFFRPVILLSSATMLGISPQQLEAVLAHELAHIRRHDYLVNVLQMLAETLLFYHPAIWWASRRIRVERELCCDDIAVQACGDAVCYAQALTSVARLQMMPSSVALGSAGGPLLMRIQRLLGVASVGRPVPPLWAAVLAVAMIVAMLTGAYAQSQSPGTLSQNTGDGAALRGRVVDARSGKPVAGASVRAQFITGIENPPRCPIGDCEDLVDPSAGRIPVYRVTTAADGSFDVRGVKPGDYDVAAVAPGYMQRYFGQTSDDMPEVPVHVAAGQSATAIEVRLEPAGSVSGRIFSDSGDGLAGVEVELLRRRGFNPGATRPMTVAFAQTEDMGTYRFRNVPAGEYYVRAYTSFSLVPTRGAGALSYTGTFFPDATDVALAQPVIVSGGQELSGVDFALMTARTRTVSGRLIDPAGGSLATAMVSLFSISAAEDLRTRVAADGRFRFTDVPDADYMLRVMDTSQVRSWTNAFRDMSVHDDVTDLQLIAAPSVWIEGRIVREDGQPLPFDVTSLQMSAEQQTGQTGFTSTGSGKVSPDGTFSMRSGAATISARVSGLPPRWFVKSVRLDGADVTDTAFSLSAGGPRRLEVTLSDRVGRLSGLVADREARAVSNALIVVFPDDPARLSDLRLSDRMRVIRTTFSQQRGGYEVDALPIASYRVVAVTSLPRNAWIDPDVIARLWPFTTRVSLDELRENTLHRRVVPAPTDLLQ